VASISSDKAARFPPVPPAVELDHVWAGREGSLRLRSVVRFFCVQVSVPLSSATSLKNSFRFEKLYIEATLGTALLRSVAPYFTTELKVFKMVKYTSPKNSWDG